MSIKKWIYSLMYWLCTTINFNCVKVIVFGRVENLSYYENILLKHTIKYVSCDKEQLVQCTNVFNGHWRDLLMITLIKIILNPLFITIEYYKSFLSLSQPCKTVSKLGCLYFILINSIWLTDQGKECCIFFCQRIICFTLAS